MSGIKTVSVTTAMGKGFRMSATVGGGVELHADQNGSAANPLDTFMFALGSCVGTIAKLVAGEKKIALRSFAVTASGSIDLAGITGVPNAFSGFKSVDLVADMDADLTEIQRTEFLDEVAHRCPIHATITAATPATHK